MNTLSFEYPAGYLLLCLAAGLLVAALLYYRSGQFREQPRALVWALGALRTLGFALLAALLLSPLLRFLRTDRQEPIVVLAQDVSESVGLETDTVAYAAAWAELRDRLAADYRVVSYTFGAGVHRDGPLTFGDKTTNLDAVLTEIGDVYGNQNLGAVVLATDGIYNAGANPAYRNPDLRAPVYTIGLGDTTRRRDLLVRRVFHNKIAYLNDRFSIQVDVAAAGAAGERTRLTVSRLGDGGSQTLHSEEITLDRGDFFTTREVVLPADRAGVQRYRVALSGIGGEVSSANNRRDLFVDVLDARQRILLLAAAPHPDVSALRQALAGGKNNELTVGYAGKFAGSLADFDLVILHQLPAARHRLRPELAALDRARVPRLFVLGEAAVPALVNAAQGLLQFSGGGGASGNEVTARPLGEFSLFTVSDELRQALPRYPPLTAPFGEYTAGIGATTVLRQRIGRVDTDYPLLAVGEDRGVRTGVLAGTGLWQWRLFDYLEYGDHARFDELVSQLTQFLTVKEDKRRFRVSLPTNVFAENEPVQLDAELYNPNYELVNEPEATVVITGPGGQEYNYAFNRSSTAYTLTAGTLPVGDYRFTAATNLGGERLTYAGRFSVSAVEVERYALEADHGLLRRLSDRFGGELLFADQLGDLPRRLAERGTVKPVLFETVSTRSVLHLKWIFGGLLLILSLEWFLRRYFGSY